MNMTTMTTMIRLLTGRSVNAVKGNLNIVNKFARQEEVRSGGSKGAPGTPLPVQILSFSIFSIVQNNSLVHPSEILDPPLVVTN